jgi:uncharacterized protein (UPF0335 family)
MKLLFKSRGRRVRRVATVGRAPSTVRVSSEDLPIADYDEQNATDIASRLRGVSQHDLRVIDEYERKNQNRSTVTDKIAGLTGDEPWSGYDEQNVDTIASALNDADVETAETVKAYELAHKDRVGVIQAADKRIERAD